MVCSELLYSYSTHLFTKINQVIRVSNAHCIHFVRFPIRSASAARQLAGHVTTDFDYKYTITSEEPIITPASRLWQRSGDFDMTTTTQSLTSSSVRLAHRCRHPDGGIPGVNKSRLLLRSTSEIIGVLGRTVGRHGSKTNCRHDMIYCRVARSSAYSSHDTSLPHRTAVRQTGCRISRGRRRSAEIIEGKTAGWSVARTRSVDAERDDMVTGHPERIMCGRILIGCWPSSCSVVSLSERLTVERCMVHCRVRHQQSDVRIYYDLEYRAMIVEAKCGECIMNRFATASDNCNKFIGVCISLLVIVIKLTKC